MDSIVQFTVNDTSPTVSYSAGDWLPCFTDIGCQNEWNQSQAANPTGSSYHLTPKTGASFTLKWRGTGISLKGTASHINYTIYLDDSPVSHHTSQSQNILASIQNVTLQDHTVKLLVGNDSQNCDNNCNVSYMGAVVYVDDTAAGSTVSLNDIKYTGFWSDDGQFKHSNTTGDVASTSFQGLSFLLYGMTSPSSGSYSVSLATSSNDTITRLFTANYSSITLPANTPYVNPDALLYYASDLDPTLSYNVNVTKQGGGDLFIRSDGFQVFQLKSPPLTTSAASSTSMSKPSKSTIAAIVLGVILFVLFVAFLLFYIFIYRPRDRRCREEFDALEADKAEAEEERNRNTVMQLEEARNSPSSSYRQRLARIISMIAPTDKRPSWRTDSQHLQAISPLSPVSTHKSDYILDISRRANQKHIGPIRYNDQPSTEEDGMILVQVPTSTLECEPQRPPNPRGEENSILHHRPKSSPDATIPVSPSVSSGGGTQSRSHNGSQPRSGRFSIPFSLSIPYVHTRSHTEDGNGEVKNGRRSRTDHRPIESGRGGDGQNSDDTSVSTIVFAEVPKVPLPSDRAREKTWDIRKSVKSFMSGLSGVGKRWYNTRDSARAGDVIYPFVSVSSTVPTQRRALSAGGGLLIIGRDQINSGEGETDDIESPREENWNQRGPPTETDITPLSYGTQSDDAFPSGEVPPQSEGQGSADEHLETPLAPLPPPPPQQLQQTSYPFSSHPYAAAALLSDPEAQSSTNVAELQNASSEGSRQRPQTAPAPTKVGFRQLPVIPRAPPPVAHSVPPQTRPHTADGPVSDHMTSLGTVTTGGRAIRALPPLPVPSAPQPTVPIASSSAEQAHIAQKSSPLTPQSAVQDDISSLPPPYPQSGHSKSSQRTSGSVYSTQSSLRPPFLNVREISPFQVDFSYTDDEQSQDEGKTKPSGAPSKARPRPTVEIPSADALHHIVTAITPRTTRSTAQCSFLDFATNSSSSNKGSTREKSEASPVSDVGPSRPSDVPPVPSLPVLSLDGPSRTEDKDEDLDDHSRRTFGQRRRSSSGSFYYDPADNMSLASPSASSFTHQSHVTHQSYQTAQSREGQRLSTQSAQRRQAHVSWRATFGGRIEGDIPEEATPSDSSPPFSIPALPARGSPIDPQPATASISQSPPPRSSPLGLLPDPADQIPHDVSRSEVRRSYMSTSSGGHSAHIHPFSTGLFSRSQYAPQAQIEPISPESTEDVSTSSPIQFRAGGIRRTSSGDVQPVSHRRPTHTRDGGSSSGGSGDLREPRHPFSIP